MISRQNGLKPWWHYFKRKHLEDDDSCSVVYNSYFGIINNNEESTNHTKWEEIPVDCGSIIFPLPKFLLVLTSAWIHRIWGLHTARWIRVRQKRNWWCSVATCHHVIAARILSAWKLIMKQTHCLKDAVQMRKLYSQRFNLLFST